MDLPHAWSAELGHAFEAQRGFLWGLAYRLTGSSADADDVVQDTFARALAHPPARRDLPLRPWLTRVALNLGRDVLRRRRRRPYDGPWLPSPVPTDDAGTLAVEVADSAPPPDARYERAESVSLAFLLALEALRPTPRAVLLLRDVFDYSVRETAEALELSEANVKVTHLRARRTLREYDRLRRPLDAARSAQALGRFLACLAARDAAGLEALLAAGVRVRSDGGGEFVAARRPVLGRERVVRFLLGLAQKAQGATRVETRTFNGLPAVVLHHAAPRPGWAPRAAMQCLTDDAGRIVEIFSVLSTGKLHALD
jgi:RNA polymerase sigma-70 factor (ECF subfamily)